MPVQSNRVRTARGAAASSLAGAAKRFPDLPAVALNTSGLSPQDYALATAIQRTALQRWITLEYLLDRALEKPLASMEASVQGVLLTGAAQLVFMDRLPAHAVVDEQVTVARQHIRAGAGALVNAVLRKVSEMVVGVEAGLVWEPGRDLLPVDGGCVRLSGALLPETDRVTRHLGVATSHPKYLINRWISAFGEERTREYCLHGVVSAPVIVAVEAGFDREATELYQPHDLPGFVVWRGGHGALGDFIKADSSRRVQDPASAKPIESTVDLKVSLALDFCAGRGTKTRQLAVLHRGAKVGATDVDDARRAALRGSVVGLENVRVVGPESEPGDKLDLLVLDVPCSNTAVLARRPEARYRFDGRALGSLVALQRQIMRRSAGWVGSGGVILYSTCSLEEEENGAQARWLAGVVKGEVVHEQQVWPGGRVTDYQDGGYHALVRVGR
jgi:16S rRNA (cytosine967-C5)-methyltransferase